MECLALARARCPLDRLRSGRHQSHQCRATIGSAMPAFPLKTRHIQYCEVICGGDYRLRRASPTFLECRRRSKFHSISTNGSWQLIRTELGCQCRHGLPIYNLGVRTLHLISGYAVSSISIECRSLPSDASWTPPGRYEKGCCHTGTSCAGVCAREFQSQAADASATRERAPGRAWHRLLELIPNPGSLFPHSYGLDGNVQTRSSGPDWEQQKGVACEHGDEQFESAEGEEYGVG